MSYTLPRRITDPNRSALHLLHLAAQEANELFGRQLEASGLTLRQFTVLLAMRREPGASQARLRQATRVDSSTLADIVARLEKRGLIARGRADGDARIHPLTLTPEGRRLLREFQTKVAEVERAMLRRLPVGARSAFMASLALLAGTESGSEARARALRA